MLLLDESNSGFSQKDEFAAELGRALVPNPDKKNKKKDDKRLPLAQLVQVVQRALQTPLCRNKVMGGAHETCLCAVSCRVVCVCVSVC